MRDIVKIRSTRKGDYDPLIIPLPKNIANRLKMEKNDQLHIYTDGEELFKKVEVPKI